MEKAKKLAHKYRTVLARNNINTSRRLACFFGQAYAETGGSFEPKAESGYYTNVHRARAIFYTPFKNKSNAFIEQYLRNSEKMLNYVYANRMGNGSEASGEGYLYRGRGIFQITGKSNYKRLSESWGVDYVANPQKLENEADGIVSAIWYWNLMRLNVHADKMDIDAISDLINLGRRTARVGDAHAYDNRLRISYQLLKEF